MNTSESQPMERAAGERRRCVRQKVHTPAYASFEGQSELSQILDISEDGAAIQTSSPPELNQALNIWLDLSETKSRIQVTGRVVRLEETGRAAIYFAELPEPERRELQEWLFLNAMMAGVNHLPESLQDEDDTPSDFTSRLIGLAAVAREVEFKGSDLDAALDLIADRALNFTSASGAAIALSRGSDMICVASSGAQAPPLDTCLQIGSGFSGECVRSGKLLRCEDAARDPRVDQESCSALGIHSMIAVPIQNAGKVIGLLEVFSPKTHGFPADADLVLAHLAEMVVKALNRAGLSLQGQPIPSLADYEDEEPITQESWWKGPQRSLAIGVAVTLLFAVLILATTPWKKPKVASAGPAPAPTQPVEQANSGSPQPEASRVPVSSVENSDLQALLTLAGQGDPGAQFAVGARYATGRDVQQDYLEAIRWFTRAAEQGHVVSQATLGAYYWAGRGVAPDLNKAYYWSLLAQNGGDQASKYRVAVLTSRLTHEQLLAAQQHADEWIRQHQGLKQASVRERLQ